MKLNRSTDGGLVYSTETGRMCPLCGNPVAQCSCRREAIMPASDGVVRVARETKRRGGKTVTVITGLALDAVALSRQGKQLKSICATGGTVKDGAIELQGDHGEVVTELLKKQGWVVKRAGG